MKSKKDDFQKQMAPQVTSHKVYHMKESVQFAVR
jgi:hypothetical protein